MIREVGTIDVNGVDIPVVETKHFGRLFAPSDFSQLAVLLEDADDTYGAPEGWRGQSNINWKVQSTAVRRVSAALSEIQPYQSHSLETWVRKYEKRLINDARLRGFDLQYRRELSELEFLACLQHYGASTRLLDFTRNAYVALWFACLEHPKEYGLLIGSDMQSYKERCVRLIDERDISKSIDTLFREWPKKIFSWEPSYAFFERMRIQQSIFVFGEAYDGSWGSLMHEEFSQGDDPRENIGCFFGYAVSPYLKATMQTKWKSILGYDVITMFPDIEGFGRHHSAATLFDDDYFNDF